MSQLKKFVQTPYFAATTGAALLAVVLAPTFDRSRGIANGQNPTDPAAATAPAANQTPNATPPNVSAINPNPLGIGATAPGTVPGAVPSANAAFSLGTAAPVPGQAAPDASNLEALRGRAARLQDELRRVPTTAEEQASQRQIVAELSALQLQIQQIEATAGQFSAYRQARDVQAQANGAPSANPSFAAGYDGILPPNAGNAAAPFAPTSVENAPSNLGDLNGLALATNGLVPNGATPLEPGEADVLRQQKEMLTRQFRQLQQTMRALQPGDDALANDLKQEQTSLLNQLKEIETRLASAPAANPIVNAPTANDASLGGLLPTANQLPNVPGAGLEVAAKTQKATQAAALLREAGLVGLANCVANEVPRLGASNFVETQYVPGAWAEGAGLAEERSNPFQQISAEEVKTIHTSIDALQTKVDALTETLSNVETQLKLLTRQTVDGTAPTNAATAADSTASSANETAPESGAIPPETAEQTPETDALGGSL